MITLHAQVVTNENNETIGIIIKYDEYINILDELEDLEDYLLLQKRTPVTKTYPLDEVMLELFGKE